MGWIWRFISIRLLIENNPSVFNGTSWRKVSFEAWLLKTSDPDLDLILLAPHSTFHNQILNQNHQNISFELILSERIQDYLEAMSLHCNIYRRYKSRSQSIYSCNLPIFVLKFDHGQLRLNQGWERDLWARPPHIRCNSWYSSEFSGFHSRCAECYFCQTCFIGRNLIFYTNFRSR